jgi:hypothetical protein
MADITTGESGSHRLRTHWERFFRVRQRPDMDESETVDAPRGATSRE